MAVTRTCTTCGIDYRCPHNRKSTECYLCTGKRLCDSHRQMCEKRGPIYEKYIKRLYQWAGSEMHRLGLLED